MFLLGGSCFVILGPLTHIRPGLPLPLRAFLSAAVITALELGCGLLVNRSYEVWDYRHLPLNYHGQICLYFSLLWIPLSLVAMGLYHWASDAIERNRGILFYPDS
jgi:uncharacterized membrane protein